MAKKSGKGSRSKSSSKGSKAKPKAGGRKKSGGKGPAAPKTPPAPAAPEPKAPAAPEGGDGGAPDEDPKGEPAMSLEDLLPMSVARKKLNEVKTRMEGDKGLLHICEVVFPNYEKHLGAYALVKSYLDDCKTKLQKGDATKYDASKFTDGSNYTPLLREIVKLNKAYQDAKDKEDEGGDTNEELEKARKELEDLKKQVNEEYGLTRFESERLTALVKDAKGIEKAYADGKKAQDDLIASTLYTPEEAGKGRGKKKAEGVFTLATWYVMDSFKAIEEGDALCKKVDGYITQGAKLLERVNPSKK